MTLLIKDSLSRSGVFRDMLDLPSPADDPPTPIPTFVPAGDLYTFLGIIEDQENSTAQPKMIHLYQKGDVPTIVHNSSLTDKVILQELADRFDCEALGFGVKLSLEAYYASLTALELLTAASKFNSVTVARVAIAKMGSDRDCRYKALYSDWWTKIEKIRPSWQVELTKLIWEFQNELVNPDRERGRYANGRRMPRSRETIMVQTTISHEAIAAAFNPGKEN